MNGSAGPSLTIDHATGAIYSPPCTFVANLHVRKCGGTTVRRLFQNALTAKGWRQVGSYMHTMQ